jgi:hypothetical protein
VSKRTKFLLGIGVIATLVIGWQIAAFAGPVGLAQGFEDDDANLANDAATAGIDWNTFAPATWSPHPANTPTRITDDKTVSGFQFKGIEDWQATTSDSGFAGGTKQDDDCASVISAKAPNKDDLKRIYLASTTGSNGHTYLDLAWVRIPQNTTSASAHIGFEFNKGNTACPAGSDGLVERTAGDILIVYDFEGGGTPVLTLRKWITSGGPCDVAANSAPCWGVAQNLTTGGFAEGAVNTGSTPLDSLTPPALSSTTGTSVNSTLGLSEFGEAGIDLTAAGVIPANTCAAFGKAYAVSRSSGNSGTAQMKDIVGPANFNLTNCGTINIIKQTSPAGINQNFDFTSGTNAGGGGPGTLAGTCTPDATPANFTLNDNADATDSLTCTAVPAGTYTVTEGANPTGFTFTDLSCTASGTGTSANPTGPQSATKVASITMAGGGTVTCTYTNTRQLGAIEVTKTRKHEAAEGTDPVPHPGVTFTVNGVSRVTDANGKACFDGPSFGSHDVTETLPDGYVADGPLTKSVNVDNNATCADSPYGGETVSFSNTPLTDIEVTATSQVDGGTASQINCVNEADEDVGNSGPDFVDPATANANDLPPGTYTCTVEVDP